MVPTRGLEPRLADSETAVLPLDDVGIKGDTHQRARVRLVGAGSSRGARYIARSLAPLMGFEPTVSSVTGRRGLHSPTEAFSILACRRGVAPLPADLETAMLLLHHRHVERAAGLAPAIFSLGRRRVASTLRPHVDRLTGVAPASSGWKPDALLLSYRRTKGASPLEDFIPLAYTRFPSV